MAVNTKMVSKINEKVRLKVYGWIRKAENELQIRNIPLMISNISILFVGEEDPFKIINDAQIILSNKNFTICKINNDKSWMNTNYGSVTIKSTSNTICEWTVKLNSTERIKVGVTNEIIPYSNLTQNKGYHYGYLSVIGKIFKCGPLNNLYKNDADNWKKYGQKLKIEEIKTITIKLNTKLGNVEFYLNDVSQGIAYDNIAKGDDINYKLFVQIYGLNTSVEIISFKRS